MEPNTNITLQVEILKDSIIKDIQKSNLPITIINYVIQDLAKDIKAENDMYTQKQIEEYNKMLAEQQKAVMEEKEEAVSAEEVEAE